MNYLFSRERLTTLGTAIAITLGATACAPANHAEMIQEDLVMPKELAAHSEDTRGDIPGSGDTFRLAIQQIYLSLERIDSPSDQEAALISCLGALVIPETTTSSVAASADEMQSVCS